MPEPIDSIAPIMRARGVGFRVGADWLVRDVDLAVRPGRRLLILGANGAGKTVLLRLLHGLIQPDAGAVMWRGRPLNSAARLRQAMVFQRPVLLRRSVEANLRFALSARGHGARACRDLAARALAEAGLDHLAGKPARVLSGGEQQRLAMARALAMEPELLFLDEPTASLDPAATQAVEQMVARAHADGVTVVMVTHDLGQARRLADDIAFLHAGRVAEAGPAADVLAHPKAAPTQAWLDGRLYTTS